MARSPIHGGQAGREIRLGGERYVVDPNTASLLSWRDLGPKGKPENRSRVYLEVGWTNEKPHVPALP